MKIITEFGQLFHGPVESLQALSVYCENLLIQIEINDDGIFQIAADLCIRLYTSKAEKRHLQPPFTHKTLTTYLGEFSAPIISSTVSSISMF